MIVRDNGEVAALNLAWIVQLSQVVPAVHMMLPPLWAATIVPLSGEQQRELRDDGFLVLSLLDVAPCVQHGWHPAPLPERVGVALVRLLP